MKNIPLCENMIKESLDFKLLIVKVFNHSKKNKQVTLTLS